MRFIWSNSAKTLRSSIQNKTKQNKTTREKKSWHENSPLHSSLANLDRCCSNIERTERELVQPKPCPGGLVFHAGGLHLRPFPRRSSKQMLSVFHSVPGVIYSDSCLRSPDELSAALPKRLDFSIVDTFAYSRVPSERLCSPLFGSHVFCGGGVPRHGCRGKRFRFSEKYEHI